MFFCPSDIFHFHLFGCLLVSQLGSLRQKCDPDRCTQKSLQSRLYFFEHQTFPIFIPLAVPWGPNMDPCAKSVILASARKIHIKAVYVFFAHQTFPFPFLWLSLGVPSWALGEKAGNCKDFMQFLKKVVRAFSARHAFPFSRFCVLVGRLSALNLVRRQFHYRVICWKELSVGRRCCGNVSSKPYTTPP